jgi:ATP-dependent DNA ligase
VHEIKLDGFCMMVRRDAAGVRLLTRNGIDWTARYPLIAAAAGAPRARSFLLDGEAVACDGDGVPVFDRLRYRRQDGPRLPLRLRPHRDRGYGPAVKPARGASA